MISENADALDALEGVAVISWATAAKLLGRTTGTLDEWSRQGKFPKAIQLVGGGRKEIRVATLRAWLNKRERARWQAPAKRGRIKRGTVMTGGER
jgi:hypothetical protein